MSRFIATLFLFVLGFSSLRAAETYHVIFVRGEIILKESQAPLKVGDEISSDQEVMFRDAAAVASVMSRSRGRFNLKPRMEAGKSEFSAYIKQCLYPSKPRLSSHLLTSIDLEDFRKEEGGKKILVLDKVEIPVSDRQFPPDSGHFALSVVKQGKDGPKWMKKTRLPRENGRIRVSVNELEEGWKESGEVPRLVYVSEDADGKEQWENFPGVSLVIPEDRVELKNNIVEIVVFLDEVGADKEEKMEEISGFLRDFYGEPDESDLKNWLKKGFNW